MVKDEIVVVYGVRLRRTLLEQIGFDPEMAEVEFNRKLLQYHLRQADRHFFSTLQDGSRRRGR